MKEKINELIKYYEEKAEVAKYSKKTYVETEYLNLGIQITCEHIIWELKKLLKAFDSKDASEETPDTL